MADNSCIHIKTLWQEAYPLNLQRQRQGVAEWQEHQDSATIEEAWL